MEMDHPPAEEEEAEKMETDEKEERVDQKDKKKKKVKKEEEPQFEILQNLSRVVPAQLKYISFPQGTRYAPVKKVVVSWMVLITAYWWCFNHERFETRGTGGTDRDESSDGYILIKAYANIRIYG